MVLQNIILDKWQEDFLNYKGHSLTCTGRRVGKTYIHARKACKRMLEKANTRIIVASLTEDQAQLIILFALNYLEKEYKKEIQKKSTKTNSKKITLKNGSTMLARPVGNTGDAIRGFEGDVLILDEVSRFNELILEAATPILLTTGGEIWMCSTPFGKQGFFYRAYQNKDKRYKIFETNTEKVIRERKISEGWTKEQKQKAMEFLEQEKKEKSELQYGQEYLGLFLDDLRRFYSDELIERACSLKLENTPNSLNTPKITNNNYLGCDIARMGGDKTTYEILYAPREPNKIIKQIFHAQEDHKPLNHTEQRIIDTAIQFGCEKIGIDAGSGSLGVSVLDHLLIHPIIRNKVVAMNNRQISLDRAGKKMQRIMNEDYHEFLKAGMEHGEIQLLNLDEIKNSFRSIQIEIVRKEDRITAVRIYGNDSHIVEGIKRAYWLAKKEKSKNINILAI